MSSSLQEIEEHWSIDDAADAHDALDWYDGEEINAYRKAKGKVR